MEKNLTKNEKEELEFLLARIGKKITMKMSEYEDRISRLEVG